MEVQQTHYGVTEMAEVLGKATGRTISKQAMSARMNTAMFNRFCKVESTRHGRIVPIDQFEEYVRAWIEENSEITNAK